MQKLILVVAVLLAQLATVTAEPRRVTLDTGLMPGSILVDQKERTLYLVEKGNVALAYKVGVARAGFEWSGTHRISKMMQWPDWRPPAEMLARQPYLPRYMAGGPGNPLGAAALYIGSTLYRIHGSDMPASIGQAASSGCIRMTNQDIIDLYSRVQVGATVVVRH